MRITATEETGLRLVVQLAGRYPATAAVGDLAAAEGLAEPFAAKVVAVLKRAGLVRASRGRSGGYTLAVPPGQITVLQVLGALGERLFDVGFCDRHGYVEATCRRHRDCALRPVWACLDSAVAELFGSITLADLVAGEARMRDRLAGRSGVKQPPPERAVEREVSQ
ncbi:MAG TPA: Rrf2 family transcriptional regulator [Thermoanaerobaculaceae bacterium]|nr:Rrf2 family transcriptional regulator [Thermoanaerobaculaceae bacterium]HRS14682.1 Rrf2 family transcriptional regulator [Thermoanaerobaculaceae bacterium]